MLLLPLWFRNVLHLCSPNSQTGPSLIGQISNQIEWHLRWPVHSGHHWLLPRHTPECWRSQWSHGGHLYIPYFLLHIVNFVGSGYKVLESLFAPSQTHKTCNPDAMLYSLCSLNLMHQTKLLNLKAVIHWEGGCACICSKLLAMLSVLHAQFSQVWCLNWHTSEVLKHASHQQHNHAAQTHVLSADVHYGYTQIQTYKGTLVYKQS